MKKTNIFFIFLSLVCLFLSQAAFTPAIVINLLMFIIAIEQLIRKAYFSSFLLFLINGLAVYGVATMMN